jgi:glutaconate CoA-transferase, subunit A
VSKLRTMREAVAELVPDGASVGLGLQMEQMIPFAAGHEVIRQKKCNLTLIGPICDILFDQLTGAGCVEKVVAAWVGNAMMGSAYKVQAGSGARQPEGFRHNQPQPRAPPAGRRHGRAISSCWGVMSLRETILSTCWSNFGVMIDGLRAAKRVIVVAEEIVEPEVISSDPNRTVVPGFLGQRGG